MGRLMVKSETAAQHLREVKRKENDVYTFIAFCSFFFFFFCSPLFLPSLLCSGCGVSGYANDRAGAAEKLLNEEQMPEPSYFSLSGYIFSSFLSSSSSLQFQPSSSTNTRLLETQLYRQLCIHTFKQWGSPKNTNINWSMPCILYKRNRWTIKK